jgi:hypothetical protein
MKFTGAPALGLCGGPVLLAENKRPANGCNGHGAPRATLEIAPACLPGPSSIASRAKRRRAMAKRPHHSALRAPRSPSGVVRGCSRGARLRSRRTRESPMRGAAARDSRGRRSARRRQAGSPPLPRSWPGHDTGTPLTRSKLRLGGKQDRRPYRRGRSVSTSRPASDAVLHEGFYGERIASG